MFKGVQQAFTFTCSKVSLSFSFALGIFTSPLTTFWLLNSGTWDDSGVWVDNATWED